MSASDLEDRDPMQGLPTDQQVAFYLRIGPGLQPLFGVPKILIRNCSEGVGRLQARLGFLVRRVFAIRNQAQKPCGLFASKLWCPRGAVRTDGHEALPTEYSVPKDVGRLIALTRTPKPRTASRWSASQIVSPGLSACTERIVIFRQPSITSLATT